jgi:hypothetical protein
MSTLLEFTIVDRFNTASERVREMTLSMLEEEADVRGWKEGYTLQQTELRVIEGGVSYGFRVEGEWEV